MKTTLLFWMIVLSGILIAIQVTAADTDTLTISYTLPPWCGDNLVEGVEQCDGTNLSGASCTTQGYDSGSLSCTVACTFNTAGCSNDGGGGGGGSPLFLKGGGGGPPPVQTVASITIATILPDEEKSIAFFASEIALNKLFVDLSEQANEVKITITRKTKEEVTQAFSVGNVYQYLEIEKENLIDKNIERATLQFTVQKSWLNEESVNKKRIVLYRYETDEWKEYPAIIINETNETIKLNSTVPGFSLFAIGETGLTAFVNQQTTIVEEIVEEDSANEPEDTSGQALQPESDVIDTTDTKPLVAHESLSLPEEKETLIRSLGKLVLLLASILIIILGILYYALYYHKTPAGAKRKFKKEMKKHVPAKEGVLSDLPKEDKADIAQYKNTHEVKKFILHAMRKGKTRSSITASLIKVGWDEEIIDHLFDEVEDDILKGLKL